MLVLSVEFLQGTFRGDPDGAANTGRLACGEWPPAPSRLFAALVAADGTNGRCRVTDGTELEWLERLPPPEIHAHGQPWHQALQPRYVVKHEGKAVKFTHQEYPARAGALIRPGVRVTPRNPNVVYVWDVEPPQDKFDALRRRAARIGYLGAADSPVRSRVLRTVPESATDDLYVPDQDGTERINVPAAGDVALLDRVYELWVNRGADISRLSFPALRHRQSYRPPSAAASREGGRVVAWLRLGSAVSGRRVVGVTALFKAAVLKKHQAIFGEPPSVLHGHGFGDNGYELARFLALPDVGYSYSRGRIHGLALWMPAGSDAETAARARDAARAVRRLVGSGIDVAISPYDGEPRPVAATPHRWQRLSQRWVTAFPAIHERRGPVRLADVSQWCIHAGLPALIAFRTARTPLIRGAVDLAPSEVNRPGRPGRPYSHFELRFEHPVPGPVVIGAGRQRGLGLCVPAAE